MKDRTDTVRAALEQALAALIELHDRGVAVKTALDADIPDGEPVHRQSAALTWPLSTAALAIDSARAALAAPTAASSGWKLLKDTTQDQRTWHEDAGHENGNYYCVCSTCLRQFVGHKRRVVCKVCAAAAEPQEGDGGVLEGTNRTTSGAIGQP